MQRLYRGYRVLYFGSDAFSLPTLHALVQNVSSQHSTRIIDHVEVVCLPPKRRETKDTIRQYCRSNHIHVHECPPKNSPWDDFVASLVPRFDLGVVASFGQIIPDMMLNHFCMGALNVHPSLVPMYRGAAPLHHTILNGDKQSGVSIIEVSKRKVDRGRVLLQRQFEVQSDWMLEDLRNLTSNLGAQMILDVLADWNTYVSRACHQSELPLTPCHASKRFKKHTFVDWGFLNPRQVYNMYRCYGNNMGLHTWLNENELKITGIGNPDEYADDYTVHLHPGSAKLSADTRQLLVQCKDGLFPITQVQFPTRRPISIPQLYHQLNIPHTHTIHFSAKSENYGLH